MRKVQLRPAQRLEQGQTLHRAIVRRVRWRDHSKEIFFGHQPTMPYLEPLHNAVVLQNVSLTYGSQVRRTESMPPTLGLLAKDDHETDFKKCVEG